MADRQGRWESTSWTERLLERVHPGLQANDCGMRRGSRWSEGVGQESVIRSAVVLVLFLLVGFLLRGSYLEATVATAGALALGGLATDLLLGVGGLLVLCVPSFMAMGGLGYAYVVMVMGLGGLGGLATSLVIGAGAAALLALLVALVTLRVGIVGLGVMSLLLLFVVEDLFSQLSAFGGPQGLAGIPSIRLGPVGFGGNLQGVMCAVVLAALAIIGLIVLVRSRSGREIVAVREEASAAAAIGISPFRSRLLLLVSGALVAAIGGMLFVSISGYVDGSTFGPTLLLELFFIVYVGGVGSFWGTVIGATVVTFLPNVLGSAGRFELLVQGAVLLLVLLIAPGGIAGALRFGETRVATWVRRTVRGTYQVTGGGACTRREAVSGSGLWTAHVASGEGAQSGKLVSVAGGPRSSQLSVQELSKSFGGLRALTEVSFSVDPGTIVGIIGGNGAGKSTLLGVISGALRADHGRVELNAENVSSWSPVRLARAGVARTFQECRVFGALSVEENLAVARNRMRITRRRGEQGKARRGEHGERWSENWHSPCGDMPNDDLWCGLAAQLMVEMGLEVPQQKVPAGELTIGQRRMVELARALVTEPALLLLDEPASGLAPGEREVLVTTLARIRGNCTVVVIEHDLDFIQQVVERVIVLDAGRVIFDGDITQALNDQRVIESYLGSARSAHV